MVSRNRKPPANFKPKDLMGQPWMLAFALRADGWYLRQDIIWAKPNPMPESVTDRCTKAHEYIFLLTKSARYYYDAEAIKETVNGGAHARGPGNKTHKGTTAYEQGSTEHRTKAGLVDYAKRQRAIGVGPKAADAGSGTKYNESFSASITDLVSTRNKRSVWEIATEPFPEAHFATFPTELVKPCILAGTSEKGCCEACGSPWQREVSVEYENPGNRTTNGDRSLANRETTAGFERRLEKRTETVGWKASCSCNAGLVPCTVLDTFNGSGTTGIVALANRCNYIGIELNPEYVAMTERRLAEATRQGVLV